MKRALATGLALALAGVLAVPAQAAIDKGRFTGETDAGDPLGLRVNANGKVHSFYFAGVTLTCSDGDSFNTPTGRDRIQTPLSVRFPVTRTREWGIRARNDSTGFGWDAEGSFNRRESRSSGTLHIFATFNDQNQQDPNGSIRCESETLLWSARRR